MKRRFTKRRFTKRRLLWVALFQCLVFWAVAAVPLPLSQVNPPPGPTPPGTPIVTAVPFPTPSPGNAPPQPTGTPTPGNNGGIIQQIFQVVFSSETLADALAEAFNNAAEEEAEALSAQTAQWALILGEVLQAPSEDYYQTIAEASVYTAAALAVPLFLLRLALYHWQRLSGEDDSATKVIGDWVTAGVLAVAAGPLLDLVAALGWWITGATLGETTALAQEFVTNISIFSVAGAVAQVTWFSGLLVIGVALGGLLAMAGMLFAFAVAQAALFTLAVLAPPLAVAGVLPQMRWLRALWLKAVSLLALMPIVAGGIFKASVTLGLFFSGQGLLSILIRLLWLWGATGLLLALAGILSRVTLSAGVEAFGQLTSAVKAVVSTAVLAGTVATGAGAAGAGASGGGAGGGTAGATPTKTGGGPDSSGGGTGLAAGNGVAARGLSGESGHADILGHYDQAQTLTRRAGLLGALGFQAPAQYTRTQAHLHELEARKLDLQNRMARFLGEDTRAPSSLRTDLTAVQDFGFSRSVNQGIQATFTGSEGEFHDGFTGLSQHLAQAGLDPHRVAEQYPEEVGRMVDVYLKHPIPIESAENPLLAAAEQGGVDTPLRDIFAELGQRPGIRPQEAGEKTLRAPNAASTPPLPESPQEPES